MDDVFLGTAALRNGGITRSRLRWNYRAMFPDVYVAKGRPPTLQQYTVGAWLWSGRRGVIAGRAAAALHGAQYIDDTTPIELIWTPGRPPPGIKVRNERIDAADVMTVGGVSVTTPARTAFDIARHLPRDAAVRHLDALAHATGITAADALLLTDRYPRARGLPRARIALALMDGGAQSPRETWLRLLLIDDGLPRPRTQIGVSDGANDAFIDMGWDEPMVGLDYEGVQHSTDRRRYVHDIGRSELIAGQGWIDLRVVAEHSRRFILHRTREALGLRGWRLPKAA